ncbi:MAG: hypothetical protein P1P65_00765 [Treponema sp.]
MKKSNDAQTSTTAKDTQVQAEPQAKKTGLVRSERLDRPLLRGHVTHLINHG